MSPAECSTVLGALALVLFPTSPLCAHAQDAPRPPAGTARQHVRCLDPRAEHLLTQAVRQSATVKALVARLDDTDVVVYVTTTAPPDRAVATPRGVTSLVTATAAARYLRVWVDPQRREAERISVLGHEVQHALEVAGDATVRDARGLARLFERLGSESGAGAVRGGTRHFETAMARDVETRVLDEVARASTTDKPRGPARRSN